MLFLLRGRPARQVLRKSSVVSPALGGLRMFWRWLSRRNPSYNRGQNIVFQLVQDTFRQRECPGVGCPWSSAVRDGLREDSCLRWQLRHIQGMAFEGSRDRRVPATSRTHTASCVAMSFMVFLVESGINKTIMFHKTTLLMSATRCARCSVAFGAVVCGAERLPARREVARA